MNNNIPKQYADDPRITAYVLGELAGAAKSAFEAELAASPELRAEVEAFHNVAVQLGSILGAEACPELAPAQRERVLNPPPPEPPKRFVREWSFAFYTAAAAAAVAVMFILLSVVVTVTKKEPKRTLAAKPVEFQATTAKARRNLSFNSMTRPAEHGEDTLVEKMDSVVPFMKADVMPDAVTASSAAGGSVEDFTDQCPSTDDGENAVLAVKLSGSAIRLPSSHAGRMSAPTQPAKGRGHANMLTLASDTSGRSVPGIQELTLDDDTAAAAPEPAVKMPDGNRYAHDLELGFVAAATVPLSTFSANVDTASYALVRRALAAGNLPSPVAVRVEELVNNFKYAYPEPTGGQPFSVTVAAADCPWAAGHKLVRVGVKGKSLSQLQRPPCNLVFLLDCSGSMQSPDKLPLLKECFLKLLERLDDYDRVGIVTYADKPSIIAEPTVCNREGKRVLATAISRLQATGCTNGAEGLREAYRLAHKNFRAEGANRVIIATDGDFNSGVTSDDGVLDVVKRESAGRIYLTVLGFGTGNLNAALMAELSSKGNGNHYYIDSLKEGEHVLGQHLAGTLVTIAKDVKFQVDFNPAAVQAYRLVGYDNRRLENQNFNDDSKDAGEIGAGHTVTAFYEIIPVPAPPQELVSRYVKNASRPAPIAGNAAELLTVCVRYQRPQGGVSTLIEVPLKAAAVTKFSAASPDFMFASAVTAFGLVLRESQFKGGASLRGVLEWLTIPGVVGNDPDRQEFRKLAEVAAKLKQ